MRRLLGAILVGGRSTRMGRDKATLKLPDGRSMMRAVGEALSAVCEEVVMVGSCDAASHTDSEVVIKDHRADAGPLGGIEALLASGLASEYIVCPCDVPLVTADVLRSLLQSREAPATVLRLADREQFEPLPARVSVEALPTVRRLLDESIRSVWRLMDALPAAIVDIESAHAHALRNVNSPDDLNTL